MCSDWHSFWNIIECFPFGIYECQRVLFLPPSSFWGKGEHDVRNRSCPFSSLISLFQTANKSSSLEASGGNFAFDSLPFFPICGLKLIGFAGFFFLPKMLKLFDWLWLWYSYSLPMKIDCSYGTKTVLISLGNLLTLIRKQKLALIR